MVKEYKFLGDKRLTSPVKVAVIDLYNNEKNEGMRCIRDILEESKNYVENIDVDFSIFDARYKNEVPGSDFDVYISSGGPGNPFDGEGTDWEKKYFNLLDQIWTNNQKEGNNKKYVFFICHSFQIMARYFEFARVVKRKSKSFGLLPVHKTEAGEKDPVFEGLSDPFCGADFRSWQVIEPNYKKFEELGASLLAIEKYRPHVPLDRAMMAVRISDEIVGTQFHPEADPMSMEYHFKQTERKDQVIKEYGIEKWHEMIKILEEKKNILSTRNAVIPNFLNNAFKKLRPELTSV